MQIIKGNDILQQILIFFTLYYCNLTFDSYSEKRDIRIKTLHINNIDCSLISWINIRFQAQVGFQAIC